MVYNILLILTNLKYFYKFIIFKKKNPGIERNYTPPSFRSLAKDSVLFKKSEGYVEVVNKDR